MKKVLLSTAAVAGLAMVATPAAAQVQLELGGYFKGYGFYADVDETTGAENRDLDIVRETEVHFGGETTLDNGLTVGAHIEAEADATGGADSFAVDESYVYFSGGWGRVNFGSEDGAAYLLQVAAPSADSNIDGIRQYVNPVNYAVATGTGGTALSGLNVNSGVRGGLDYDQDVSGKNDKLTYLSPIMNGFQLGASYTPEVGESNSEDAANTDDVDDNSGSAYDLAVRYEGQFNNVGVIAGAGYSHVELEEDTTTGNLEDDREAWNVGVDLDIGPFGVGVAYLEDNYFENDGASGDDEEEAWVVGVDYTTGPFKLGASYMDIENTGDIAGFDGNGMDTQRYTGGVVYTYGPGMTFRGSISHVEIDNVLDVTASTSADDVEATTFTIGTQINF